MSFQQGLSGLNATSKNLEVIGNNVANASTFGAKASRAEFADMYAASLNGAGTNNIGIGVNLAAVAQQFTQGNITTTGNPMDLAINGAGFFQVTDGRSPVTYTRNGQFKVDRDGYIVNNLQQRLMGYMADGTGTIQPGSAVGRCSCRPRASPEAATGEITMEMNLDSRAATTRPPAPAIDFDDPTHLQQRDLADRLRRQGPGRRADLLLPEVGHRHLERLRHRQRHADLHHRRRCPGAVDDDQLPGQRRHHPTAPVGGGDARHSRPRPTRPARRPWPITGMQLDLVGATQYGSGFGVTNLSQNGYAPGQLSGISIESNGIIMARYSNGQSKPAGQVELATFRNPQGLQPLGGNDWTRSFASGDPVLGVPGDGNLGTIQSGSLEESNTDLTGELVNMITAQRVYQANAQTIKTQDQVLQTLVNLR